MKFENANVLITGGGSGIGRIMGKLALQKGAKAFIIWDINIVAIEAAKKEALGSNLVENAPGQVTSAQQAGNPHVMRTCDDVEGRMPGCDRNCRLCYRKHCKFRQV